MPAPQWYLPRGNDKHVPKGPKGGQFAKKGGIPIGEIKIGQRLDFSTGTEHGSNKAVTDFRGAVARKSSDGRVMVNTGTKVKPRWVVAHADHASVPTRKPGVRNDNRRKYQDSLTSDELKAIDSYQLESYTTINSALRRGETPSTVTANRIKHLDTAVAKGKLAKDTTLYRAGGGFGADPAAMVGKIFTDHGFVSTSEHTELPLLMAGARKNGVYVRIKAPAGASVGYLSKVRNQQAVSKYGGVAEQEALLPRGSAFTVTKAHQGADGMWTVDMELLA